MSAYDASYRHLDAKTRRKLLDERRMRFRRAIEQRDEGRRLQVELADYPELAFSGFPVQPLARSVESAPPAR